MLHPHGLDMLMFNKFRNRFQSTYMHLTKVFTMSINCFSNYTYMRDSQITIFITYSHLTENRTDVTYQTSSASSAWSCWDQTASHRQQLWTSQTYHTHRSAMSDTLNTAWYTLWLPQQVLPTYHNSHHVDLLTLVHYFISYRATKSRTSDRKKEKWTTQKQDKGTKVCLKSGSHSCTTDPDSSALSWLSHYL